MKHISEIIAAMNDNWQQRAGVNVSEIKIISSQDQNYLAAADEVSQMKIISGRSATDLRPASDSHTRTLFAGHARSKKIYTADRAEPQPDGLR